MAAPMASSAAQRATVAVRMRLSLRRRTPWSASTSEERSLSLEAFSIFCNIVSSESAIFSRCSAVAWQDSPELSTISVRSRKPAPAIAVLAQSPYSSSAPVALRATSLTLERILRKWSALTLSNRELCLARFFNSCTAAFFCKPRASLPCARSRKLRCAAEVTDSASCFASSAASVASFAWWPTTSSPDPGRGPAAPLLSLLPSPTSSLRRFLSTEV
mmetsp:Transcript_16277/g.36061  ORF Transcript_16277/g.36061 Transcript_16277/m.36061 type:complete len:217 (-) Transcript_16277:608-1258(-)